MDFTHERRAGTDVFTTTDPAGRELARGAGEGRRVVSASLYTVAPVRYYDAAQREVVTVSPPRWSAAIEMDAPDRFHDRSVHGGFYNERSEAEAWIVAMLGDAPAPLQQQGSATLDAVRRKTTAAKRLDAA